MSNKRILFVDDEPLVLQGLHRMLRSQRHEWEMEFADNAAKALERMALASFDVIVSDMCMPGMNGAQLLAEVMRRHPKTVRIVLSGHADKELILQCAGSAHHYLSKPCDPDVMKAVVQRALSRDDLLPHERLRAWVGKMEHLPTVPALYQALVEALQDSETSIDDIGRLIGRDIGMTAGMLKLVNSAFFGLGRTLSDPTEAVYHLGLDTVKSLVLAIGAFVQFCSQGAGAERVRQIWLHSLAVAACARMIASAEGAERKIQDEAYVAGLLHDVGKLVLVVNLSGEEHRMLRLAKEGERRDREAECEVFGADHAAIGGYLLGLWGLPAPLVEAVAYHHQPILGPTSAYTPLTAVHVGNALAQGAGAGDGNAAAALLDADYLRAAGVLDRLEGWRSAWKQIGWNPSL